MNLPEDQMRLPEPVLFVMNRLEQAGFTAYAVGGCVRDHLMHRTPGDYDVTTSAKPAEMQAVFHDCRVVETGLKHGTLTIVRDGMNIETTTYRIDGSYDDGRHPDSVTFTDQLSDDLCRRDFTINAMACSPQRGIVDLYHGREDLASRTIRCVGDACARFHEDGLRILRALRFASTLDFTPDAECADAARDLRCLLDKISRERIYVELTKLLCGTGASRILSRFPEVISQAIPHLDPSEVTNSARYIDADEALIRENFTKNIALRYALLFDGLPAETARDAMNSLKPSRDECRAVMNFTRYRTVPLTTDPLAVKRLMRDTTDDFPADLARYHLLTGRISRETFVGITKIAQEIVQNDDCRRLSQLRITGRELGSIGFRGKDLGDALAALLEEVMAGRLENSPHALTDYAERLKNE